MSRTWAANSSSRNFISIAMLHVAFPNRLNRIENGFHQAGNCSSTNFLLCSWSVQLVFCLMPHASSAGSVQEPHPKPWAPKRLAPPRQNKNSRDHQALEDLRWPLVRSYVFWKSVLMVGFPTRTIKGYINWEPSEAWACKLISPLAVVSLHV
jgi:hypothetical protein